MCPFICEMCPFIYEMCPFFNEIPCKMLRQQELSDRHVAMRAEKCRKLLQDITEGMLPNLVFTDKKKFDIQQAVNQKNDSLGILIHD